VVDNDGAHAIDVRTPTVPRWLGQPEAPGQGRQLLLDESVVYMAAGHGGLAMMRYADLPDMGSLRALLPAALR